MQKIKDHQDFVKDPDTNSIVNTNKSEYKKYIISRNLKKQKVEKVQNIEDEVANMKSDISEIKSLLKELLNGSR